MTIKTTYAPIRARESDSRGSPRFEALNASQILHRNKELRDRQRQFYENPLLAELRDAKDRLPIIQHRDQILEMISGNTCSIITGAAGGGKTTQVPQIILEDAIVKGSACHCKIYCTQTHQLAVIYTARRVAYGRNEQMQDTVGYRIRLDVIEPKFGGSITYSTAGALFSQLDQRYDEILDNISHLVIDEIYQKDVHRELLLGALKRVLELRQIAGKHSPRLVLMSAAADAELFKRFLQIESPEYRHTRCLSLDVLGRAYPVNEFFLEDVLQMIASSDLESINFPGHDSYQQIFRSHLDLELTFGQGKSHETKTI